MSRLNRVLALSTVMSLLLPPMVFAQSAVDLIPDDATVAFVVNGVGTVRDKGDKFIKQYELKWDEGNRPTALIDSALQFFGLEKGVDPKGAAAIVLPNLKKLKAENAGLFDLLDLVYAAAPVEDIDAILKNYGLKKDDVKPGKIREMDGRAVLLKGKHLFVARKAKALSMIMEGQSVTAELGSEQKAALTKSDIALHLGVDALGPIFSNGLDQLEQNMKTGDDADNSQAKQFIDALRQIRFIVGGLTLDDGGKINVIASFNKGKGAEAATKFLTALRAGPGTADLVALPAANPVALFAAKGDGVSNVAMTRALINLIFSQEQLNTVFGKDRKDVVTAFETMYKELKGSRIGLYPTSNAEKFGRIALVGILDLGDVEKHLDEWPKLVKLFNQSAVRMAKDGQRKPMEFSYQPKTDKFEGLRQDVMKLKIPDLTQDEKKFFTEYYGPDWDTVRMVVVGKQVAFLHGSDLGLLKETVDNIKGKKPGLAENKLIVTELARLAPERKITFHFNLRNLRLQMLEKKPEEITGLTSFALSIETDRVQLEIVASKSEVKPFAAFLGIADD
jgi:hypothetical protein